MQAIRKRRDARTLGDARDAACLDRETPMRITSVKARSARRRIQ
jgi:hypothetical protein